MESRPVRPLPVDIGELVMLKSGITNCLVWMCKALGIAGKPDTLVEDGGRMLRLGWNNRDI